MRVITPRQLRDPSGDMWEEMRTFCREQGIEVDPVPERPLMWSVEAAHLGDEYLLTQDEAMAFMLGVDAHLNRPTDGLTNQQRQVFVLSQKMSQAEVARRLGISKQRVSQLMTVLREKGVL